MNRKALKTQAKQLLKTHYWKILIPIVFTAIVSLNFVSLETEVNGYGNVNGIYLSLFSFTIPIDLSNIWYVVIILVILALLFGIFFSDVINYGLDNKLKHFALGDGEQYDLFSGFHTNYFKIVKLNFFVGLEILLWMCLFIVPGIIKAYQYQFVNEILDDNPEWSIREIKNESKRLTQGHKWELFVLNLSFFGWVFLFNLLNNFTFGIASYFLKPYTSMTNVYAYLWLKEIDQTIQPEFIHNENTFNFY